MEIYISEKEAKENDVVVAKNNYLQDSRIQSNSKNVEFILKSLDQHDAEVKADERKKVIDEIDRLKSEIEELREYIESLEDTSYM